MTALHPSLLSKQADSDTKRDSNAQDGLPTDLIARNAQGLASPTPQLPTAHQDATLAQPFVPENDARSLVSAPDFAPGTGASYTAPPLNQEARDTFLAHFPENKRGTVANWLLQPIREFHADTPALVLTLTIGRINKMLADSWATEERRQELRHALSVIAQHRDEALACADYYLSYASLPEDERQKVKQRQRDTYRAERPPTDRQLDYLRILGYIGTPPATLHEASEAIERLLAGRGRGAR